MSDTSMEDGSQELQTVVDDSEVRVAINGPATREVEFMVHQEEPTRFDGINPETLAKLKKLELKSENLPLRIEQSKNKKKKLLAEAYKEFEQLNANSIESIPKSDHITALLGENRSLGDQLDQIHSKQTGPFHIPVIPEGYVSQATMDFMVDGLRAELEAKDRGIGELRGKDAERELYKKEREMYKTELQQITIYGVMDEAGRERHRTLDGQPPATFPVQGAQPGGEEFLLFIETILRPWVHSTLFPNVQFKRDGPYGHSLGGLFTAWVLLSQPDLFDTFIVGSPALVWNNNALIGNYSAYLNTTFQANNTTKPALKVTYGSLEAEPIKRRTETDEQFETRKKFYASFSVGPNAEAFYGLVDESVVRDKEFQLYGGSDHSSTAASTLTDGIDYFLGW